jgi:hypothetical protein
MFNEKPYYTVNREERHFGFLFGSAIIHNQEFAKDIFQKYNILIGSNLNVNEYELFLEVAALRDFWYDLGDSFAYIPETHSKRRKILDMILKERGYGINLIDHEPVFWTNGKIGTGKLWCPSEWNISELKRFEKCENDLASVRWSFNAKPDVLIVSNNCAVFIEIKVESGGGRSENGYNQLKIQKDISSWMKLLIPEFSQKSFFNTSLTLNNELDIKGLTWNEVIESLKVTSEGKPGSIYVEKCLGVLNRYKLNKGTI